MDNGYIKEGLIKKLNILFALMIFTSLVLISSGDEVNEKGRISASAIFVNTSTKDISSSVNSSECKACKEMAKPSSELNKLNNITPMFGMAPPLYFNASSQTFVGETLNLTNGSSSIGDMLSEVLVAHNKYRSEVCVPSLTWSSTLASDAQTWANHLASTDTFQHDPNNANEGENILWSSPSGYRTNAQLVDMWGAEEQYFKWGTFPDVSTTGNWQDVGHYTQIIWQDTTQCGCGLAKSATNKDYMVCRYSPPGNYMNQPVVHMAPAVTNSAATSITQTSARLNGAVTCTGGQNPTVHVCWGTVDKGANAGWAHDENLGTKGAGTFSKDISSLTSGVTYYYRCYATNSYGTGWASSSSSFTTQSGSSISVPTVTNDNGASSITSTSARLNGVVTNTGGENPHVGICFGTSDGGTTNWMDCVGSTSTVGQQAFYVDISNLTPGTTYYYRCYATNSAGTGWASSSSSFTTSSGYVNVIPVYRMFSPAQTDHFYTTDYNEYCTTAVGYGYKQEGILGHVFDGPIYGAIPLYRMYSPTQKDHFYTTDYNEYCTTAVNYGYRQEGILGYIGSSPDTSNYPIYRMWGPANTDHFYTTDYYEYCVTAVNYGYKQEGILGYATYTL